MASVVKSLCVRKYGKYCSAVHIVVAFFCLLRSVIGSVFAATVQSARRQARRCSPVFVRVSHEEVPARHEDGMFHTSCIYIQIAWIPLMAFGLVGRAKSTGNEYRFFFFFLKMHPQCGKKKPTVLFLQ